MTNSSPIEKLANIAKANTELEVAKVFFESVLTTSPVIDRSASWLLVGLGTTTALIVANLEKTSLFIGNGSVSILLWLLLIGGLFGLAQKYVAVLLQIHLNVNQHVKRELTLVLEVHKKKEQEIKGFAERHAVTVNTKVDFSKSIQEIKKIVPWYQRPSFKRNLEKSLEDPLHGQKRAARLYNRQVVYALAEVATTVGAVVVVATNI